MARRKKRSRSRQAKADSPEAMARAAAEHLERGAFKDAAADYKRLLKQTRRPEWVQGLAQAYAGRAQHLASRGMLKEAIALWQNRAEACDAPLADPRYCEWLLAAGRRQQIADLYHQAPEMLAGEGGMARLRAQLAAAALADGNELIEQLPADDPVARDYPAAEAALAAFARDDAEALDTALARIPFRSPYRDFRQLLKAWVRREQDPDAADELWARVPADTPFAGIRRALEVAGQADAALQGNIAELPADILTLVAALLGWNEAQVNRLPALARLGPSPDQPALCDFVIAHQKALGQPFAREAAFALAGLDNRAQRRLIKKFNALPLAERARLVARGLEAHGALDEAIERWLTFLDVLAGQPDADDNRLRRALIHRHIADLIQPPSASLPLTPDVVDHLASSLALDPGDRDSHLRLIDHYLHLRELKPARQWVDRALQQFPDDIECLFRAAQTAVAGAAYKKAAGFAQRILAIDPINPRGRGLLVDAHLSHARKKANQPEAARRELEHAAHWARSGIDTGRIDILHGLITRREAGAKAAAESLNTGIARAGGGLTGRFYLLLEAARLDQDLQAVTRAAALPAVKGEGNRAQVLTLVRALGTLRDGPHYARAVEAALVPLAPAINQAAQADFDREESELLCETLLRYRQYRPLTRYARTALQRWPRAPLFVFYKIQGDLAGRPPHPWAREGGRLEAAYDRARGAGDTRTAERIGALLDSAFPLPRFEASDPFVDVEAPGDDEPPGANDVVQALIDDMLDPALRSLFEMLLGEADLRRLQDALRRDEPVPFDIQAKLAALPDEHGAPSAPLPSPAKRRKKNKNKRDNRNPLQGDLF